MVKPLESCRYLNFWQIYKYFRFYASLPAAILDLTLISMSLIIDRCTIELYTAETMGVAVGISSLSSIVLSLDIRAISWSPKWWVGWLPLPPPRWGALWNISTYFFVATRIEMKSLRLRESDFAKNAWKTITAKKSTVPLDRAWLTINHLVNTSN